MVVKANYDNDTNAEITEYTITNGTNLVKDQTSVTISYTEDGVTKTCSETVRREYRNMFCPAIRCF